VIKVGQVNKDGNHRKAIKKDFIEEDSLSSGTETKGTFVDEANPHK